MPLPSLFILGEGQRIPWWAGLGWRRLCRAEYVVVPLPLAPLVRGALALWWWARTGCEFRAVSDSQRIWMEIEGLKRRERVFTPEQGRIIDEVVRGILESRQEIGFTPNQVAQMRALLEKK